MQSNWIVYLLEYTLAVLDETGGRRAHADFGQRRPGPTSGNPGRQRLDPPVGRRALLLLEFIGYSGFEGLNPLPIPE